MSHFDGQYESCCYQHTHVYNANVKGKFYVWILSLTAVTFKLTGCENYEAVADFLNVKRHETDNCCKLNYKIVLFFESFHIS
jgi:hypothetical protein